ncbi:MAG: endolytic transglycosylase MltG [Oscillospiraceae bacterium]|nr:endolytic transglycosylase MltG [Oscillospiraceae bacterium]
MSDDRLSKTDELAEILGEYRAKKKQAERSAEEQTQPPAEVPAEAPAEIPAEVPVAFSDASSGAPEGEFFSLDAAASHFTEDESTAGDGNGASSHFTEDADGAFPDEPEEDDAYEDEDDEPRRPLPVRMLLGVLHFLSDSSFLLKAVLYMVVVVLIAAYLSYHIVLVGNDMFALKKGDTPINVTIPEGASQDEVIALLADRGLIESEWAFSFYLDHYSDGEELIFIPGEHALNTNMNYSQLLAELTIDPHERQTVTITFPEGFTVDDVIDLFVKNGVGTREGFVEAINNYPYKHEFVRLLDENGWPENRVYRLEGYLYPDTYDFYTDTEEYLAINKLLNNFNDKIWVDWKSTYAEVSAEQGFSLDDIVTLASMVQAEGKTAEDFEYISYVFHNRLNHSREFPNLESDATIQYAFELAGLDRVQDASQINIDFDSPYNTYRYEGLPPGAICNAGLDSFLAAIYPSPPLDDNEKEINAYFFVSNDAGKTYYAATLSAHERNKERVRQENEAMKQEDELQPEEP